MSQATSSLQASDVNTLSYTLYQALKNKGSPISVSQAVDHLHAKTSLDKESIRQAIESEQWTTLKGSKTGDRIVNVDPVGDPPDDIDFDSSSNLSIGASGDSVNTDHSMDEYSPVTGGDPLTPGDLVDEVDPLDKPKAELLIQNDLDTWKKLDKADTQLIEKKASLPHTIAEHVSDAANSNRSAVDALAVQAFERYNSTTDVDDTSTRAVDVEIPAGKPRGIDQHLHGLPILETPDDKEHPFIDDVEEYEPYYTRRLVTGESELEFICRGWAKNRPVALVGHAGTGKDTAFRYVAAATKQPLLVINMDGKMLTQDLLGIHTIDDDGTITFEPGPVPWAAKLGWKVVFSELSGASEEVYMTLQNLLERDSRIHIKQTNELIVPRETFGVGATFNPPEYKGANELNEAFLSRWFATELPYLEPRVEKKMIANRINTDREIITQEQLDTLVKIATDLREKADQKATKYPRLSPRHLLNIADKLDGDSTDFPGAVLSELQVICMNSRNLELEATKNFIMDHFDDDVDLLDVQTRL